MRDQWRTMLYAVAAACVLVTVPAAGEEKLYKWVDEDGNVTYQDQPPPDDSGQVQTLEDTTTADQDAPAPDVEVVLYAIEACDVCDMLRDLLIERRVPFEERNAETDPAVQAELKEVSGELSVPVLTVGDEVLKGYNKELILNELEEAGFSTSIQASTERGQAPRLGREDLEGMTPAEIEDAARDSAARGEDNDLFEEDEGFATLNEDVRSDSGGPAEDDITQWEEIPEDERIRIDQ